MTHQWSFPNRRLNTEDDRDMNERLEWEIRQILSTPWLDIKSWEVVRPVVEKLFKLMTNWLPNNQDLYIDDAISKAPWLVRVKWTAEHNLLSILKTNQATRKLAELSAKRREEIESEELVKSPARTVNINNISDSENSRLLWELLHFLWWKKRHLGVLLDLYDWFFARLWWNEKQLNKLERDVFGNINEVSKLEQEIASRISENSDFLNKDEIKSIINECLEIIQRIKSKKQELDTSLSNVRSNLILSNQQLPEPVIALSQPNLSEIDSNQQDVDIVDDWLKQQTWDLSNGFEVLKQDKWNNRTWKARKLAGNLAKLEEKFSSIKTRVERKILLGSDPALVNWILQEFENIRNWELLNYRL